MYVLVAVMWFVLDVVLARYIIAVGQRKAVLAATLKTASACIVMCGAYLYTKDLWYMIPVCIGTFAGQYVGVRRK